VTPPRRWSLPHEGGMWPAPPGAGSPRHLWRALAMRRADASRRRSIEAPRSLRLPAFLGIGAQKAGTTWLHANLAEHPAVFLPEVKELHWIDWNWHRSVEAYASWFESAGDRLAGEITPAYAIAPEDRVAAIAGMMPGLRAIMLLRDPVERAWSQTMMNLVRFGGRDVDSIPATDLRRHLQSTPVLQRSRYSASIDRWRRHLSEDRVLIGFFDEISAAPAALLSRVLGFLGLDGAEEFAARSPALEVAVNRGGGETMPEAACETLVEALGDELSRLADRFGEPCISWKRRWLG